MAITRVFSVNLLNDFILNSTEGFGFDPATTTLNDGGWATAGVGSLNGSDYLDVRFYTASGGFEAYFGRGNRLDPSIADISDFTVGQQAVAVASTTAAGHIVLEGMASVGTGFATVDLGDGSNSDVAASGIGLYIGVAYQRNYTATDNDIIVSLRNHNGTSITTFAVDNSDKNDQNPSIAWVASGFVVAWNRIESGGQSSIWYASYDSDGTVRQGPTLIDAGGSINRGPSVEATRSAGGFIISYEDNQSGNSEIKTYMLDDTGIPVYTQNTSIPGPDRQASVADIDGLFATAFTHEYLDGDIVRESAIHLSLVDNDGVLLTDPADPITIAASGSVGSNPSISGFGYYGEAKFIVSYNSDADGQVHQQLAQIVETITGDAAANSLGGRTSGIVIADGKGGDDTLLGNGGNDRLIGGTGVDTMYGRAGNDTFYVDNAGDKVIEDAGNGTLDWVATSVSYTLAAGVEVEIFGTTATGAATAIDLTGNQFVQSITGNAGANRLNGAGGADTMKGLGGNDTYYVDNSGDKVIEGAGQGTLDWVASSVTYTLAAGVQVERLSTTSSGATTAIDLTGNQFAQTITGNAGANRLNGSGGADTMTGLGGNDTYYIDNIGDKVVDGAGQGTGDWVATAITYALAAGVQVERLSTTISGGTTAINLTGNEFAQVIIGNAGANVLIGRGGSDTLTGAGGADTFFFDSALGSANIDRITDYNVAADSIRLENAIFTAIVGTGTLTAAQFVSDATGVAHDANDRIIYETDTGKLFYDSNGSAAGGSIQFAILTDNLALTNADFQIV